jgi:predicted dithiol-disulfide oxidoreductase (DUF899 family)
MRLMSEHRIATQEEWQAEREALLEEEKELTRRGDELAEKRRGLPWVAVEKDYRFETADGTKTLAELFDGRSQLMSTTSCSGRPTRRAARSAPRSPTCAGRTPRLEPAMAYYGLLDRTPKGRDESPTEPLWIRRHDEYEAS